MAVPTLPRFLEILRLSGLIDEDDLVQFLTKEYGSVELPQTTTPQDLAERLLKAGVITTWHAEKLLDGKYKGFRLGNYRLRDFLGSGGMSSVYLAEHVHMHQSRAVKVLPRKKNDESSRLKRFYLEARASAQLRHPNIVQVYDIDSAGDDIHYIVMEYVRGRDLAKAVREDGPLPFDLCLSYMIQAAEALQHAHENGLVHRDVKPGNFLVDDKGTLKCMDLGLALFAAEDDHSLTQEFNEKVLGTADYLSPEQALNSHNVDYRADIYSLGCTIYYCLTGSAPFPEGTLAQRILNHQTRMPEDPRVFRPEIPQAFVDLIWRMIQKRPEDRLQTAAAVAVELRRLQSQGWDTALVSAELGSSSSGVRPRPQAAKGVAGGSSPGSSSDVRNKPPSKIEREAIAARDSATGRSGPQAAPTAPAPVIVPQTPTNGASAVVSGKGPGAAANAPVDAQLAAIAADRQAHRGVAGNRKTPSESGKHGSVSPSDSQRGRSSGIGKAAVPASPVSKAPSQAPGKRAGHTGVRIEAPATRTASASGSSPGAKSGHGPIVAVAKMPAVTLPAAPSPSGVGPSAARSAKTAASPVIRSSPSPAESKTEEAAASNRVTGRRPGKKAISPLAIVVGVVAAVALAAAAALAVLFSGSSAEPSGEGSGGASGGSSGAPGRRDTSSIVIPAERLRA